jgi:ribokinase
MKKPKILVIGSLNMDLVVEAERSPQRGETILGKEIHFIPGGKGANQAIALARLGAETSIIGAVGPDSFGQDLLKALQTDGVDTSGVKVLDKGATGVASILLAGGDNSIVVVPGANAQCLPEDLDRQEEKIREADLIVLQLEIPLKTVEYAVKLAKKQGKPVLLNPAPAQTLSVELLQQVDFITPNRFELELLAGMGRDSSLEEGMDQLINQGVSYCITTLGAEGAAYKTKGQKLCRVEGHNVSVVDTTGAGDAFNGGLAYALAGKMPMADAMIFAGQVSALAVTKFGAQGGMPTLREVQEHFCKSKNNIV